MKNNKILEKVLFENKIEKLNPVQEDALYAGLLEGKNLIISSPTSSGKTLIAEIAGLNTVFNRNQKMIYLCPLVALAREKFEDFKRKYEKYGVRIALSIGNYDSSDPFLARFHWIVCSNEKFDSLIRHEIPWISEIGLIVVDEIHLLDDFARGPTLEILLTLLKRILPNSQLLAFSATIKNAEEIGKWLGAEVIKSTFRPVPLYKGISTENVIKMYGRDDYFLRKNSTIEEAIVEDTVLRKKQLIFFLSSRKNAEALAERLSKSLFHFLEEEELSELEKFSEKIKNFLEIPTEQCKKLAKCIKNGVAFYHSGLLFGQRILIEELYKKGLLKVITSTTALAYGINLPTWRAVIRDTKRYERRMGSIYIPVLEVEQMFGRSGRLGFDTYGEGILIARNKEEERILEEYYIKGEIEEISSKIANDSVLRFHVLSLIANNFCKTQNSLIDFFRKTFFGTKYGEIDFLREKLEKLIFTLEEWGFIKTQEIKENGDLIDKKLNTTIIGKRINQLYIDPLSARLFLENLTEPQKVNEFSLFCLFAQTSELKPSPSLSAGEIVLIEKEIIRNQEYFFFSIPEELDDEYEEFQREVKLALIFSFWIEEKSEEEIRKKLKITPGELRSKLEILDWLIYSVLEIGKLIPLDKEIEKKIKKLRARIKYGIKEELIPLVKLRGIGRIRARLLYNKGYDSLEKIKKASFSELIRILKNQKIVQEIKNQLS